MGLEGIGGGKIVPIEWLRALDGAKTSGTARTGGEAPAERARSKRSRRASSATGGQENPGAAKAGDSGTAATDTGATEQSRRRQELFEEIKADLETLPDVRREKVIEAKLRISQGYYEREDVRREILRSVLQSMLPGRAESRPESSPDDPGETSGDDGGERA